MKSVDPFAIAIGIAIAIDGSPRVDFSIAIPIAIPIAKKTLTDVYALPDGPV